ncbi:hypothetical protein [Kutzneria albida]|uniref:aspartate kinase n=1 Tax=Kutzneria albida DSM 43870 TaxID=1449976 RepID=W5W8Z4_9PSEU|nr:hypothetical protein [Kutzneria albida]AHH97031.1 hypothetical protein KALB_3667 [Kutzneria albida DSM 43870]
MKPVLPLVMKFGGTVLADEVSRALVVQDVARAVHRGMSPVVVVSAMGRRGDAYATDTLLDLLLANGVRPTRHTRDLMLSCGEAIATALTAHLLTASGMPAVTLAAGKAVLCAADRRSEPFVSAATAQRLRTILAAGTIPVVAGFQAVDGTGEIITLGRGGSDLTAVAVGAALGARVEIVKDVDGVLTCDPGLLPAGRRLTRVSYPALSLLAALGNQVVQGRAVSAGWRHRVPMLVRRVGAQCGTEVTATEGVQFSDESGAGVQALVCTTGLTIAPLPTSRALSALPRLGSEVDSAVAASEVVLVCLTRAGVERLGEFCSDLLTGATANCARLSVVSQDDGDCARRVHEGLRALQVASIPVLAGFAGGHTANYLIPGEQVGAAAAVLLGERGARVTAA